MCTRSVFQAEGMANVRALRQECSQGLFLELLGGQWGWSSAGKYRISSREMVPWGGGGKDGSRAAQGFLAFTLSEMGSTTGA